MITSQLAAARRAQGLTAAQLSALTGLQPSNIYAIERGRRQARAETLETIAAGLGLRFVLVDTRGRASVAEVAARIRQYRDAGDIDAAGTAFLQLVNTIRESGVLAKTALTQEAPPAISPEWDATIAGTVEWLLRDTAVPLPAWVLSTGGDPSWGWSPWGEVPDDSYLRISPEIPEPLQRRGILVEQGELEAA